MIDLNDDCFQIILKTPIVNQICSRLVSSPQENKSKIIQAFFKSIDKSKRRHLTLETLNRFLFVLNEVWKNEVISLLELKMGIQNDLEGHCGYEIDKKTL